MLFFLLFPVTGWSLTFKPMDSTTIPCPPEHGFTGYTNTYFMSYYDGSSSIMDLTILNESVKNQFTGYWLFEKKFMQGELEVWRYKPVDHDPACTHGAEIFMSVISNTGLPSGHKWEWLQYYNEGGDSGSGKNIVDPYIGYLIPPAMTPADNLPFSDPNSSRDTFEDNPLEPISDKEPHWGYIFFNTFIASWDGEYNGSIWSPKKVNVYGEVTWGFRYHCYVPEPTTVLLLGLGLMGLAQMRRKFEQ